MLGKQYGSWQENSKGKAGKGMCLIRKGWEGIVAGVLKGVVEMDLRIGVVFGGVLAGCVWSAEAQRVEFQRQKFDRSRFSRPGAVQEETVAVVETPAPAAEIPAGEAGRPVYGGGQGGWNGGEQGPQGNWSPMGKLNADGKLSTGVPAELAEKPKFELVPKKWFDKASEYEKAKELQKETGACILVYFKNPQDSSQKGLCNWFEKASSTYTKWRKALPYFIKVEITLPGNSETRALAETFGFKSTPAWYVVRPDAQFPKRLPVIKYAAGGKDPEPMPERELIPALHGLCPAAYDGLF